MSNHYQKQIVAVDCDQVAVENTLLRRRQVQPKTICLRRKIFVNFIFLFVASYLLTNSALPTPPASTRNFATTVSKTPAHGPFAKSLPVVTEPEDLVEETDHCIIYYPEGEQTSASFIGIVLDENLERLSADLGYHLQEKIKVFMYPDLDTFHEAIEMPDAPDWVVAAGYVGGFQLVTPRLISGDLLEKTIIHELTHALQGAINPDAPIWMIEGIAMYEAGMVEGVRETVRQGIQENDIPILDSFETMDTEGFEQAGGYIYGYTAVDFAVQTYGKEILAEWVKTPRDYERVFGISAATFEGHWRDWLIATYMDS